MKLNRGPIRRLYRQHRVNCGNFKRKQTSQESDEYLTPQMQRWLSENAREEPWSCVAYNNKYSQEEDKEHGKEHRKTTCTGTAHLQCAERMVAIESEKLDKVVVSALLQ